MIVVRFASTLRVIILSDYHYSVNLHNTVSGPIWSLFVINKVLINVEN
jgi:hypothetical protein